LEKPSSIGKIASDCVKYSPFVALSTLLFGPVVALSTAIPAFGYSFGAWIENRKNKKKTTWNKLKKEIYTGNVMGHVDYALFSMPEYIFKAAPALFHAGTFASMTLSALVINPLFFIPVNIAYNAFYYIRDNYGIKNFTKGIFNGKIFSYIKDTYRHVKKNLWQDTKNVFKMFPLHFFQMHYLPSAPLRMAQSAFINNPIYRKLTSKQEKLDSLKMPTKYVDTKDRRYSRNEINNNYQNNLAFADT